MRYFIRTLDGNELVVHNGSQLVILFRQRFLDPEDEIRQDGSKRWRKLRDIPEYAGMIRYEKVDRVQFKVILYTVTILTFGGLLLAMLFG